MQQLLSRGHIQSPKTNSKKKSPGVQAEKKLEQFMRVTQMRVSWNVIKKHVFFESSFTTLNFSNDTNRVTVKIEMATVSRVQWFFLSQNLSKEVS